VMAARYIMTIVPSSQLKPTDNSAGSGHTDISIREKIQRK
jgi:hypothetical protein